MRNKIIKISNYSIANNLPFTLIAGPCQLESKQHAFKMVKHILKITKKLKINFIYKTSFDKANRTSLKGKRGIGLEKSLSIFDDIKENLRYQFLLMFILQNNVQYYLIM